MTVTWKAICVILYNKLCNNINSVYTTSGCQWPRPLPQPCAAVHQWPRPLPQPCAAVHQEVPHTSPDGTVVVDVRHGVLERRLQCALLVFVKTQNHAPHKGSEPGKEVKGRGRKDATTYSHLCQCQSDSREKVEVNLWGWRGVSRCV